MVVVPRLPELRVPALLDEVANDPLLRSYLPDLRDVEGKIKLNMNRQYLFNVVNTLRPQFFKENMSFIMQARKDQHAEKTKSFIDVRSSIYDLIANSKLISKSKILSLFTNLTRLKRQSCPSSECLYD
jgi:hypothetical protein